MNKIYKWFKTTTGHIMEVNGKNRWFIKKAEGTRWGIYEIVKGDNGCLLREYAYSLNGAKHRAYLIECQEKNSRYGMQIAE